MSFPRYEKYKKVDTPWLPEVPKHWDISRIRRLCVIKKRIAGELGFDVLSITQSGIQIKDTESNDGQLSMDYSKYQLVEPGDFAMNHMDLLTGYVDISKYHGVTSPDYRVFSLRDATQASDRYLLYLLQMGYRNKLFFPFGQGSSQLGRWRLPTDEFHNFLLPLPPLAEQKGIAAFLDRETAKIDGLIAEQRRLIELLKEKRQATVAHAVTKGLDPQVRMRDSGVEWLGEVPAHWQVVRVKDVAKLESGHTPSKQVPEYWEDCRIPWVSLNDSKQLSEVDYIFETAVQINELGLKNSSARMLPAGAVVFTRDATIGLAAIIGRPMAVSQHLIAWCPSDRIEGIYLLRVFNAMKAFLDTVTFGATIKTIGMADVKKLVTPAPPMHEQKQIVDFISKQISDLDALLAEARRAILLLQERRSALISAAVTGQIDVRGAAPASAVAEDWNTFHATVGSFADEHSTR